MMTVAEEVERAVEIASTPQMATHRGTPVLKEEEVAMSISSKERNAQKASAAAPFNSFTPEISLPGREAVRRSPAFSLCDNSVEESSGDKEREGKKVNPVKPKRPRDAQLEGTVTCTDCGIKFHWASLARHKKMCHLGREPLESGVIRGLMSFLNIP